MLLWQHLCGEHLPPQIDLFNDARPFDSKPVDSRVLFEYLACFDNRKRLFGDPENAGRTTSRTSTSKIDSPGTPLPPTSKERLVPAMARVVGLSHSFQAMADALVIVQAIKSQIQSMP